MKRFLLALIIILMLAGTTMAEDVTLGDQTFVVTQNDQLILLTFQRAPFGPGETGIATLTCEDIIPIYMNYSFATPFCTFMLPTTGIPEITVRYILYGNELLLAPENALNFTKQVATE